MFSPAERRVIKLIGSRKISILALTDKYYWNRHKPINANNYMASVVRNIIRKCEYYELNWMIKGSGSGRAGRTIWRENVTNKQ